MPTCQTSRRAHHDWTESCAVCNGGGTVKDACPSCGGYGQYGQGGANADFFCNACDGTGEIDVVCDQCAGTGGKFGTTCRICGKKETNSVETKAE